MKHLAILSLITLNSSLFTLSAAVPLSWTVDTTRAQPATFEAYQGETLTFEAALQAKGKPLEAPLNYSLFWQTNGMGNAYWEAPANVEAAPSPLEGRTNVLFATWLPAYDVGAKVYNCFIGSPSNIYHAAFQLRLRPSPGALPNALPLPTPVIDFARVRVLNPPWSGGGGGSVDTNAVRDIVRDVLATNGIRSVDGAARPLPKYLHLYEAADSYPAEAEEYYRQRGSGALAASCSAVRSGGLIYRNFDFPFDDRAEFVVKMSAGKDRFASVGVAQVGTNLTEQIVTSGKPEYSHLYKWLPGATVDGINENGVVAEINVVDGAPQWGSGAPAALQIHPLAAVRWALDHATNAQHAAEYIASRIAFPAGWTQNFHYMIADETATYIVENGTAYQVTNGVPAMTNFRLYGDPKDTTGEGQERYVALTNGANITSQWWTLTYTANGYRASDLPGITGEALTQLFNYWENNPRESHRGESFGDKVWWQTVHTSIYDITNRTLRVAVQETDDWYAFQVPSAGGVKVDAYTKAEADAKLAEKADAAATVTALSSLSSSVAGLQSSKADKSELDGYVPYEGATGSVYLGSNTLNTEGIIECGSLYASAYLYAYLTMYGPDYIETYEKKGSILYFPWASEYHTAEPYQKIATHGDLPVIDAADPTFSNAIDKIVRSLIPTTLRAYDPVRQCWWNIQPVNGVLTLTVED